MCCSLFFVILTIIVSISVTLIGHVFFRYVFLLKSVIFRYLITFYIGLIFIVDVLFGIVILLSRSLLGSIFLFDFLVIILSCFSFVLSIILLFMSFLFNLVVAFFLRLCFAVHVLTCSFRVLAFPILFSLLGVLMSFRLFLHCRLFRFYTSMTIQSCIGWGLFNFGILCNEIFLFFYSPSRSLHNSLGSWSRCC